jgi:hypothetical protein
LSVTSRYRSQGAKAPERVSAGVLGAHLGVIAVRFDPYNRARNDRKSKSSMARRSKRFLANASPRSGGPLIRSERRRAMQDDSTKRRNFNSMSVPGLSDEARQAVNAAFDAMSAWRIDTAKSNEKNGEQVIEPNARA